MYHELTDTGKSGIIWGGRRLAGMRTSASVMQCGTYLVYGMKSDSAVICPCTYTSITRCLHAALGITREYILLPSPPLPPPPRTMSRMQALSINPRSPKDWHDVNPIISHGVTDKYDRKGSGGQKVHGLSLTRGQPLPLLKSQHSSEARSIKLGPVATLASVP